MTTIKKYITPAQLVNTQSQRLSLDGYLYLQLTS